MDGVVVAAGVIPGRNVGGSVGFSGGEDGVELSAKAGVGVGASFISGMYVGGEFVDCDEKECE